MAKTDYKSVDEYIGAQPVQVRPALQRVRQTIRKALPGASEGISYQIPVFRQDGAMVLFFAGYARHYAIYPAGSPLIEALGSELDGLLHGKSTIRFPLDGAFPTRLITKIARLRAAEAAQRTAAKAAKKKAPKKKAPKKKAQRRS